MYDDEEELKARIEAAEKTLASFPSTGMIFGKPTGFQMRSLKEVSMTR